LKRAAKHLGIWWEDRIVADDETTIDMVTDIALFEPNQRKRRAYDRFLEEHAHGLDPTDLDLADRMASAFFSIFRAVGRHPAGGIWVEDILNENRRLWVFDEGLESSAPHGLVFGMRLFDLGPFHAGFGIVVSVDEEIAYFCAQAKARGNPLPVRNSLAATLYSDEINAAGPLGAVEDEMLGELFDLLTGALPDRRNEVAIERARPKRRRGAEK
jgi:hypothetical protein